ncbi:MAG: RNHCP domain-containing protein [Candidatus Paceibacterota bacterium]
MTSRFKRQVEDFVCVFCGAKVEGDGYTNHCPLCLWSLHVDIDPGDRASLCGGHMEPIKLDQKRGEFVITHKCLKCGHLKPNKISSADRVEEYLDNML